MIAALILSLEEAEEQFVELRPITSLELIVSDGKLLNTIVLTTTAGRLSITFFTGVKNGPKSIEYIEFCL